MRQATSTIDTERPIFDDTFTYGTSLGQGCCYLQVWKPQDRLPVIIVAESPTNVGVSISHAALDIAVMVWHEFIPDDFFRYIEAWLDPRDPQGDRFEEVLFEVVCIRSDETEKAVVLPRRRPSSRAEVERLIGHPYATPYLRA